MIWIIAGVWIGSTALLCWLMETAPTADDPEAASQREIDRVARHYIEQVEGYAQKNSSFRRSSSNC